VFDRACQHHGRGVRNAGDCAARADLTQLVTAIFESWKQDGVAFAVLRNYEGLPAATLNDIDVLVSPHQLVEAERSMLMAAKRAGYTWHNRVRFSPISYFFFHPSSLRQIQIDLFSTLQWHCVPTISAESVLATRVNRGLFDVPAPVQEAVINLLMPLIYTGRPKEKYKPQILNAFSAAPRDAVSVLAAAVGDRLARRCVDVVLIEHWADLARLSGPLRKAFLKYQIARHPWKIMRAAVRDAQRIVGRAFQSPGITVAILAAERGSACGVGEQVVQLLESTFRRGKGVRMSLDEGAPGRLRIIPATQPATTSYPRWIASIMSLLPPATRAILRRETTRRLALFRNGLVLIDASSPCQQGDRRSLRIDRQRLDSISRVVRRADLVFLVDKNLDTRIAPPTTGTPSVKGGAETQALRQLVRTARSGVTVDGTESVERVASHIAEHVLHWMAERTGERHRLRW
jgi:hypothetical protein